MQSYPQQTETEAQPGQPAGQLPRRPSPTNMFKVEQEMEKKGQESGEEKEKEHKKE